MITLKTNEHGSLVICREDCENRVVVYDWCLSRFVHKLFIAIDPDIVTFKAVICEIYEIYKYQSAANSKYQTIEITDLEDDDSLMLDDQECRQIIEFINNL